MEPEKNTRRHRARIASLVPGRLRIRLHAANRSAEVIEGIKRGLQSQVGIREIRVNQANGGITVRYDQERHSTAGIFGLLEDLDVVIESVEHLAAFEEPRAGSGDSAGFLAAMEDINTRIHAATGLSLDLKLVLPLAFAGAGIWTMARKGLMTEGVPGWLLLWLAFDIFLKLHPSRD